MSAAPALRSAAPALQLVGVEHTFVSLPVLKDIEMTVTAGEIVGYVGPNGAGKTTTLRIAATLVRPRRGRVTIAGRDALEAPSAVRPLLGLMPEQFGVYDDMQAAEYLRFFADAYRLPRAQREARVAECLAETGLDGARAVSELSKGMKQRLFFVRTLLHQPVLVLLDEPFSGMDPAATAWTVERIRAESRRGRAFLVSSHDLSEIERLATRIVGIRKGRLVSATETGSAASFRLRVAGQRESARQAVLARWPEATLRDEGEDGLELHLPSAPPPQVLLRELVTAGVPLIHFEPQRVAVRRLYGSEEQG